MTLHNEFEKIVDKTKSALETAKETVSEAVHRSTAKAEQSKREAAGDELTTTEKVGSFVNQKKNEVQANVDATKREVRNNT